MSNLQHDWLCKLQEDIWEEKGEGINWRKETYMRYGASRKITEEEWRRIWRIVDELSLAVKVNNSDYGFRFCLSFFVLPSAVGVIVDKGDHTITLLWDHFEYLVDTDGMYYDERFNKIWELCRPYFDTDRNRYLVKTAGLEPNMSADHYRY